MTDNNIEQELEQEYQRFIDFGGLLDKRMRTYIAQYIQNKFNPNRFVIPELMSSISSIFSEP
jgi:hypothetical protein